MICPAPQSEEEEKEYDRMAYEIAKEDLIEFHEKQGYDKKTLKMFLVNSLKKNFERELKEDGLL